MRSPVRARGALAAAVAVMILACSLGAAASAAASCSGGDTIAAQLKRETITKPLPADFVSFSIEVFFAIPTLTFPDPTTARPSWVNLMQNLRDAVNGGLEGPGPNVRIGGSSADDSVYLPGDAPLPEGDFYRINQSDFAAYAASVPAWNGSLTLDINFRHPEDATLSVAHVAAAVAYKAANGVALEPLIREFEIGNEPDLYARSNLRPTNFTYADYVTQFASYAHALKDAAAGIKYQGATYCCEGDYGSAFPSYISTFAPLLGSLSYHRYPLYHGGNYNPTVAQLLEDAASAGQAAGIASWPPIAAASGLPWYIGEGNSVAAGGRNDGVSDSFASALWGADILMNMAAVGVTRWNFYGYPNGPWPSGKNPQFSAGSYTLVDYKSPYTEDAAIVQPLYYGLWAVNDFISRAASLVHVNVTSTTNRLVKVWGSVSIDGQQRVMVIHKDLNSTSAACVSVALPPGARLTQPAKLVRLTPGPGGAYSTTGVVYGGQTYDGTSNGVPTGTRVTETVDADADNMGYTISVAPLTLVILTLPAS